MIEVVAYALGYNYSVCMYIIMCVYAFWCEHNEFVNQVDGRYGLAVHFSLDWSVCLATGSRIIVGIPSGLRARKKQTTVGV